MNEAKNHILGEMPVRKAITKIAIPGMASMMIMAIYNLVDTLFIGMLGDDKALSAVAVAFPIMTLMGAIGQVLGAGSAATIGRYFGAQDNETANKVAATTVYTAIISGVVFMLVGFLFMEPIFKMFGTTDSVMEVAKQYGGWMYVGAIFSIPNQSFNNIARAETKAALSMRALMLGAVANIILDPLFMFELGGFGLNMGIEGASMATTLAQAITGAYIGWHFFGGKMAVSMNKKYFKPSKAIYGEVLRTGTPIGVTNILTTLTVSATNIAAITFASDIVLAENIQSSYGVILKVMSIMQYIVMGYLMGYQPIASYSYGAKNSKRFYECFNFSRNFVMGIAFSASAVMFIFAPTIMTAFTKSESIIETGAMFLRYNSVFFMFTAVTMFMILTFQATGNGKFGALLGFARQGLLCIPLLFVFGSIFGSDGIFYAQPFADITAGIISLVTYRSFKKSLDGYFGNERLVD